MAKTAFYAMEYEAWDMGTNRMSLEDEAAYLRLCHWMYRAAGPIENWTIYQLCGVWRCHPNKAHAILKRLKDAGKIVETPDGHLTNTRVTAELKEMDTRRTQRVNAARTAGAQSWVVRDKPLKPLEADKPTVRPQTNGNELHYTTLQDSTEQKKESPTKSADESEWSFDVFWKMFPNKVGKEGVPNRKGIVTGGARQAFDRVCKSGVVTWADFMAGLTRYVNKTDDRAWCNPTTFLNQSRWADEPAAAAAPKPTNGHAPAFVPKPKAVVAWEYPTGMTDTLWLKAMTMFRINRDWDPNLGPTPFQPGSFAPKNLWKAAELVMPPLLVEGKPWGGASAPPALDELNPPPTEDIPHATH